MIPRELRARRGEMILPKWLALLNFIGKTNRVVKGRGVRVQTLPSGGIYIYAEDNFNPWDSPLKVRVSAGFARVRPGFVNGVMPAIGDVRLDGTLADGTAGEVPKLEIEEPGEPRSYIAIKLTLSEKPVDFDIADPLALQIAHVPASKFPPLFTQGGAIIEDDNTTLYPLAMVTWTDKGALKRVYQITHHNLNHRFAQGDATAGKPSRHFFWAA